jgi:hypothetical protein
MPYLTVTLFDHHNNHPAFPAHYHRGKPHVHRADAPASQARADIHHLAGRRRHHQVLGQDSRPLVEIDLANESDWVSADGVPTAMVDSVFRRFLHDHGQEVIAEHFELSLTLGGSIVDTSYSDDVAGSNGQLFLVLNTESSFPLGIGTAIDELGQCHPGMGVALYDTLRQALYRWVRLYDDWEARNRIEQMLEWAEGEDDPDSYEIPNLDRDLRSASEAANRQRLQHPWMPSLHPPTRG